MSNVQNTVKQIFRKYIKDTFKQDVENLKYIFTVMNCKYVVVF